MFALDDVSVVLRPRESLSGQLGKTPGVPGVVHVAAMLHGGGQARHIPLSVASSRPMVTDTHSRNLQAQRFNAERKKSIKRTVNQLLVLSLNQVTLSRHGYTMSTTTRDSRKCSS